MNDQDRFDAANSNAELVTRIANAVAHRDHRRTNLNGGNEGDDMTPPERMRFAFTGQPKAARYDGDSESAPAREPRCTCGHSQRLHDVLRVGACVGGNGEGRRCVCITYEPDTTRALHSDPTGNAGTRPDKASADLKRWDAIQRQIATLANEGADLLAKYGPARVASDADRAALAKTNTTAPKVCDSCGDLPLKVENSDVKGNLDKPGAFCDWCYRWIGTTGRKPTDREAEMHRSGKNPKPKADNHVGAA